MKALPQKVQVAASLRFRSAARLWHRDGKPGYLPDVPRTLDYIVQACSHHVEFGALGALVSGRVLPAVQASLGAGRA